MRICGSHCNSKGSPYEDVQKSKKIHGTLKGYPHVLDVQKSTEIHWNPKGCPLQSVLESMESIEILRATSYNKYDNLKNSLGFFRDVLTKTQEHRKGTHCHPKGHPFAKLTGMQLLHWNAKGYLQKIVWKLMRFSEFFGNLKGIPRKMLGNPKVPLKL